MNCLCHGIEPELNTFRCWFVGAALLSSRLAAFSAGGNRHLGFAYRKSSEHKLRAVSTIRTVIFSLEQETYSDPPTSAEIAQFRRAVADSRHHCAANSPFHHRFYNSMFAYDNHDVAIRPLIPSALRGSVGSATDVFGNNRYVCCPDVLPPIKWDMVVSHIVTAGFGRLHLRWTTRLVR